MNENKGIVVSGGQFQAGVVAVGDHARAEAQTVAVPADPPTAVGIDDLRARVAALAEQIRASGLPDAEAVAQTADQAGAELARTQPNPHTLRGLLAGLATAVAGIGSLAESVEAIGHAVSTLG